jgi:hypothetical protein
MAADAAKKNSFRAVKNQKIACDFLIFYRSLKFYLPPQAAICLMRHPPKKSFAANLVPRRSGRRQEKTSRTIVHTKYRKTGKHCNFLHTVHDF